MLRLSLLVVLLSSSSHSVSSKPASQQELNCYKKAINTTVGFCAVLFEGFNCEGKGLWLESAPKLDHFPNGTSGFMSKSTFVARGKCSFQIAHKNQEIESYGSGYSALQTKLIIGNDTQYYCQCN